MAWCRQPTKHYLPHCWPISTSPYCFTKSERIKLLYQEVITIFLLQINRSQKKSQSKQFKWLTHTLYRDINYEMDSVNWYIIWVRVCDNLGNGKIWDSFPKLISNSYVAKYSSSLESVYCRPLCMISTRLGEWEYIMGERYFATFVFAMRFGGYGLLQYPANAQTVEISTMINIDIYICLYYFFHGNASSNSYRRSNPIIPGP